MSEYERPPVGDMFDLNEPISPQQWAMHGLLTVYYAAEKSDFTKRTDDLLHYTRVQIVVPHPADEQSTDPDPPPGVARAVHPRRTGLGAGIIQFVKRRWALSGGLAAALVAGVYVGVIAFPTPAALAGPWREAVRKVMFVPVLPDPFLSEDPKALADAELRAQQLAARQRHLLKDLPAPVPPDPSDPEGLRIGRQLDDYYHAAQDHFRQQRNLGRWSVALAQTDELIEFARASAYAPWLKAWLGICLKERGDLLASLGDVAGARDAYESSLAARELLPSGDETPITLIAIRALHLAPIFWSLSDLALSQDDAASAGRWLTLSGDLIRDLYANGCAVAQIDIPSGATLAEVFHAAPQEFRDPPYPLTDEYERQARARFGFAPSGSFPVQVRAQLYREARLERVRGNFVHAQALLQEGESIRDYPAHDDERLAFAIPLEAARIHLVRNDSGDAQRAIDELDRANSFAGVVRVSGEEGRTKMPISPVWRLEAQLIRAAALLELDPASEEGHQLLIQLQFGCDKLTSSVDAEYRRQFARQFEPWNKAVGASGRPTAMTTTRESEKKR